MGETYSPYSIKELLGLFNPFSVFPYTLLNFAISKGNGPAAVLLVIFVLPLVAVAIGISVDPLAVFFVVFEFPFVAIAIGKSIDPVTI